MSSHSRVRALWPALAAAVAAGVAAEAARRVLTPRSALLDPVRVEVETYFSDEEIARGRRYARPQLALLMTRSLIDAAVLALIVRRPPRVLRRSWSTPAAGGAVTAAGLGLALSLPTLPVRAVSRRRAMAVGLDTQSWGAWCRDLGKVSAIQTVFMAGGGAAVVALTRRFPRMWWAPLGVGSVAFGTGLAALAPIVLDPIFNDFEPLPEGQTRSDVLGLARDAGVSVGEVYSVDASRRTTAANAYVTGLGPTKRVVLFDTLLDRYQRDEIRLVV
ncbi:MAG: M48 family metalloprotease, partial [Solirubrobacteraceae bacterium]